METSSWNGSGPFQPHGGLTDIYCFLKEPTSFAFIAFVSTDMAVLLPVCTFVLHHGLQQWRKRRSSSSSSSAAAAAAAVSHSDVFTYHMVLSELVQVFGCLLCCCGFFTGRVAVFSTGFTCFSLAWFAGLFFHLLTCLERYLAVVHAVAYLRLRGQRGVRIRNASAGSAWLLSFVGTGIVKTKIYDVIDVVLLVSCLGFVSFCCFSVLRVLIRPGPGERGGARARVDQSKQRAFYTITAILAALLLRFSVNLSWGVLDMAGGGAICVLSVVELWVTLPSSLVLPLLFLHRNGHDVCCKSNTQAA